MKKLNVGIVGYGQRGHSNLDLMMNIPNVTVIAVCDLYCDRAKEAGEAVQKKQGEKPFVTTDYKELIAIKDIDAVVVCSSWDSHVKISIDAMRRGKAVGMEVGGAYSLEECADLVKAYEETKSPFMFLENCCYGKNEMMISNIVNDGLFGEIVHCHGAYAHDLREEVATGLEKRHYRLNEYINRNCENYPTHELGPIAKILKINNGNRMVSLVSVASKSAGLEKYVNDRKEYIVNKELIGQKFKQGDIINTIITCEGGETISLVLDTTLPRSYSREFTIKGVKGMFEENTNSIFLDGDKEDTDSGKFYKENFDSAKKFEKKYLPQCWKTITEEEINAGHGGMDYFLFSDFFDKLIKGEDMPIDVYDAAAWMSITCLSEESIKNGNIPVKIPDFTNGKWNGKQQNK